MSRTRSAQLSCR